MAAEWSTLPAGAAASDIKPFELRVPQSEVESMLALLKASPVAPSSFLSSDYGTYRGVTHSWITQARDHWLNGFSWADAEKKMNRHPQFKAKVVDDDGFKFDIHFVGLFSKRADAIPVAFFHGWPGSFLEFLELFDIVKSRFTPENSPYHFIAPSLPGYTLSSGPPPDKPFGILQASTIMDKLLVKLGFENGYVAHGGDVGSFISTTLALTSDRAKGIHLTMTSGTKPEGFPDAKDDPEMTDADRHALSRGDEFWKTGFGYALEHDTRPGTIGFVLSSSPLALLAWIGEKMREWSDARDRLSLDTILTNVSLYWLTNTISRSMWPYIGLTASAHDGSARPFVKKPTAVSHFPYEILNVPEKWLKASFNLTSLKVHDKGGHFAAWEQPELLWSDVEDFVTSNFPNGLASK